MDQDHAQHRGAGAELDTARAPALILGVAIDDLTMAETVDVIGELVASGRRQHRTHQVATVNVDFLVNALADESLRQLLQFADVCIADGMPVVWGASAAGMPVRERVSGADLIPALAERAASTGWRIHLFGSMTGTAERAAELLRDRYPGVNVTGCSGPFLTDVADVDDDVLRMIEAVDADILCVALGNPKQERFIHANRSRLRTPVMIGVGGTLDLLIGNKKRAPKWVQAIGLEWVVRVSQEPQRLAKRYLRDAYVFFPHIVRYVRCVRRFAHSADVDIALPVSAGVEDRVTIASTTASVASDSTRFRQASAALDAGKGLRIELGASDALNAHALATLVGLVRRSRRVGTPVDGSRISAALTEQLRSMGLAAHLVADDASA